MARVVVRWIPREAHRMAVAKWHSHHDPTGVAVFALGAFVEDEIVAACVLEVPSAPGLQDGATMEITRLAVGPDAPRFTASRLLGAASRVMDAAGVTLQVSYTRVDESGTCYLAANWSPVAWSKGRKHDTGNRKGRDRTMAMPGIIEPKSETIDHVRWERGERAPSVTPNVEWDEGARMWRRTTAMASDIKGTPERVAELRRRTIRRAGP